MFIIPFSIEGQLNACSVLLLGLLLDIVLIGHSPIGTIYS